MKGELFKYALEVINEDSFSKNDTWIKLHEKDRFYNWYHGYTRIRSPYYDSDGLNIIIYTSATSGSVTTQFYGGKFSPELVEGKVWYSVSVYPPESVRDNENVTLHLKLDKISMRGLAPGSKDRVEMNFNDLDADETTTYKNFTPPRYNYLRLLRDVSAEDINKQKLDMMPGFRFTWWYTGTKVTPDKKYKNEEITKQFVR